MISTEPPVGPRAIAEATAAIVAQSTAQRERALTVPGIMAARTGVYHLSSCWIHMWVGFAQHDIGSLRRTARMARGFRRIQRSSTRQTACSYHQR